MFLLLVPWQFCPQAKVTIPREAYETAGANTDPFIHPRDREVVGLAMLSVPSLPDTAAAGSPWCTRNTAGTLPCACDLGVLSSPTCHSDVDHSLGNAVFNHAGVGGISSDVVQEGNHLQSDVFRVQLVAGVGSEGQVLPSVTTGHPVHSRAREPARGFALQRVPMAAVLHLHHGHAEGFGKEGKQGDTQNKASDRNWA